MVHIIDDPVHDPRWSNLLDRHPAATVFHTPGWLEALHRTYGYESVAVTTSGGARIENGLVACRVRSWRSNRVVSVPFSDHCEPLASAEDLPALAQGLTTLATQRHWGGIELRPRSMRREVEAVASSGGLRRGQSYCLHALDLSPELSRIFAGFQHSSAQRAVRRAAREGVTSEAGSSDEQIRAFFALLRMSRRRHGLPPQPITWFRNLRDTMGRQFTIYLARHKDRPIAALLMLSFKHSVVYKYGGSDASMHSLGAMPFLFWQAIQDARAAGAATLDLGRSDLDQPGLIAFKDHLGASRSITTYYGFPSQVASLPGSAWFRRNVGRVVSVLPDTALDLAGRLLYRRLG